MPLVGGLTSISNANLTGQLGKWNTQKNLGIVFGSSTGFTLPNGAVRSPNSAWIQQQKWQGKRIKNLVENVHQTEKDWR